MSTENPADAVREALYGDRDVMALADLYARHVMAMTREGLHDKADIAIELAHRDSVIAALTARVAASEKRAEHWRELYRIERAMRLMDNGLSSLDACYAAADKEIAAQDAAMQEPQP